MESNESINELLLSRLPQPANLAAYQKEVTSLLAENEKKLRRNKWTVVRVWIFVVLVSAPFLWMAGTHFNTAEGNWFLGLVGFWVLFGAIEIAKYEQKQGRVELLKELKVVQLQILQLHALFSTGGTMSGKP
ncbi:MAG TPA: hypothetical protein VGR55_02630 [Candidatus Acidoferrum sp.]|nr:hypothetical protein [Candidatus Acidoferrum sp.]